MYGTFNVWLSVKSEADVVYSLTPSLFRSSLSLSLAVMSLERPSFGNVVRMCCVVLAFALLCFALVLYSKTCVVCGVL